jgi:hypothetical protein
MGRGRRVVLVLVATTALLVAGPVGPSGGGRNSGHSDTYSVGIDRRAFTTEIDNPFLPLKPGNRWVYEGTGDGGQAMRSVVEVTSTTREVMGVKCVVVRDKTTVDGQVVEDTFDWYAQDVEGNVWYFGQNSLEYAHGRLVSAPGNWEAGVSGARAGMVMMANARVGDRYDQEFHPGEDLEVGEVLSLDERMVGQYGMIFDGVLEIRDYAPLGTGSVEHRYFARDVGMVREVTTRGGSATSELVGMNRA